MMRFVVIGICPQANILKLDYKGRVIFFAPKTPAIWYRLGEVIRIRKPAR